MAPAPVETATGCEVGRRGGGAGCGGAAGVCTVGFLFGAAAGAGGCGGGAPGLVLEPEFSG
jgi:hypothetical protein